MEFVTPIATVVVIFFATCGASDYIHERQEAIARDDKKLPTPWVHLTKIFVISAIGYFIAAHF